MNQGRAIPRLETLGTRAELPFAGSIVFNRARRMSPHIQSSRMPAIALLAYVALAAAAHAQMRTWTDRSGGTIEAELIAAYEGKAYLINKKGVPFFFPAGSFIQEDIDFVIAWVKEHEGERRTRVKMSESTSPLTKFLRTRLVVPGQGKKGFQGLEVGDRLEPEFYVFYEGANWCGPCHRFCPLLTAFYRAQMAGGDDNFEVVFLSADNSEGEMRTYMQKMEMPWPAVRFRDADASMFKNYGGRFVPRLVVTDRLGRVLLHSEIGPGDAKPGAHDTLGAFNTLLNASNRYKRPPPANSKRKEDSD
jgi:thiol-disulfide isomerase/thioredoxin